MRWNFTPAASAAASSASAAFKSRRMGLGCLTPEERDAEAKHWERGISFDEARPMSPHSQALWEIAERGRGRPRKPANEKAKQVLISLDPALLADVEAFASSKGLDRSKLFALSVQAFMAAEHAIQEALSEGPRAVRKETANRA